MEAHCQHRRNHLRMYIYRELQLFANKLRKLLLRIYGPQAEHLIDREAELQILRRLARKHIGPRLLGTFTNGRFEEFFHAKTLTAKDIRIPDTSKQIAKRMRELHEGIDLLKKERNDGPFVWQNWDKWIDRAEQIVTWLDKQVLSEEHGTAKSTSNMYKQRGLICGVEWPIFRKMIEKYRQWLNDQYGGIERVNERLVFAHNDVGLRALARSFSTDMPLCRPSTVIFSGSCLLASHLYSFPPTSTNNSSSSTLNMRTRICLASSLRTTS